MFKLRCYVVAMKASIAVTKFYAKITARLLEKYGKLVDRMYERADEMSTETLLRLDRRANRLRACYERASAKAKRWNARAAVYCGICGNMLSAM